MEQLFEKLQSFKSHAYGNVVEVSEDFSEVASNNSELEAINLVLQVIEKTKTIDPHQEFYYGTAINYPFETNNFTMSRYSDGSFPIWYGSTDTETTIYETAYHMLTDESSIEPVEKDSIIYRDRVIYTVYCDAILIDLIGKQKNYPDLISNSYTYTQDIGKQIHQQGHPGLISPSARYNGNNLDIFRKEVLSNPKPKLHLSYELNLKSSEIAILFEDAKYNRIIKF